MAIVPSTGTLPQLPPGFELSDSGKVAYLPRWLPIGEARQYIADHPGFKMTAVDMGAGRAAVVTAVADGGVIEIITTARRYKEYRRLRAMNTLADALFDTFIAPAMRNARTKKGGGK